MLSGRSTKLNTAWLNVTSLHFLSTGLLGLFSEQLQACPIWFCSLQPNLGTECYHLLTELRTFQRLSKMKGLHYLHCQQQNALSITKDHLGSFKILSMPRPQPTSQYFFNSPGDCWKKNGCVYVSLSSKNKLTTTSNDLCPQKIPTRKTNTYCRK